jgi:hypothetical protein
MPKNKWKEAVEEQLEICGLNAHEPYTDPKKALEHLIGYNFESGYKECERRNEWKEAVIEDLVSWHCYKLEHENDPRKALNALIVMHSNVAADLYKRDRWYRRHWYKLVDVWYNILFKIGRVQPPF